MLPVTPPQAQAQLRHRSDYMHTNEVGTAGTEVALGMQRGALPDMETANRFAKAAREAQRRGVPGASLLHGVPLAQVPLGKEDTDEKLQFYELQPSRSRIPETPALEAAELFVPGGDEPGSKGRIGTADHRFEQAGAQAVSTPPRTPMAKYADVNVTLWQWDPARLFVDGVPMPKARMRCKAKQQGGNEHERLLRAVRETMQEQLKAGKTPREIKAVFCATTGVEIFTANQLEANGHYLVVAGLSFPGAVDMATCPLPHKLREALAKQNERRSSTP